MPPPGAAAANAARKSPLRTATLAVPADTLPGPPVADVLLAAGRDPRDPVPAPDLRRFTACDTAMLNRFFTGWVTAHGQTGLNTRQRNMPHLFTWREEAYGHPHPYTDA